jgi:hypothetical protein
MFVLASCLLFATAASSRSAEPPLKVLFIGNSYTFVNDLPSLVVSLADAAGGRKIETGQHLVGGCTLERHVKDKKAVEKIREKPWDIVVLQEHSLQSTLQPESMYSNARLLDEEIKKRGAKTVFYLTWARQHIPQMQEGANPAASPDYARAMFQMAGSPCVFYATLLDKSPVGLPGELKKGNKILIRLAPDEATMFQKIAWQTVQDQK